MNVQYPRSIQERQPMPAYREAETRQAAIRHLVGILLQRSPELFEDVPALTSPPSVDERAIDDGYGPYGHDFTRNTWARLATDVVAKEEEISNAFAYWQEKQQGKNGRAS